MCGSHINLMLFFLFTSFFSNEWDPRLHVPTSPTNPSFIPCISSVTKISQPSNCFHHEALIIHEPHASSSTTPFATQPSFFSPTPRIFFANQSQPSKLQTINIPFLFQVQNHSSHLGMTQG